MKLVGNNSIRRQLLAAFVLLLIWQAVSAAVRLPFIPSPLRVFPSLAASFFPGISMHLLHSLRRLAAGILASLLLGVPLGLSMGYWSVPDRLLSPLTYFVYPIPKIALLPVVMLLFGLGDAAKITMIVLIVVFQIVVSSRDAVRSVPREAYHSLLSLGAGPADIFLRIILPASAPGILTSIRVSLGTALSVLFFTETFGTSYGLGYFIMDAWLRVNYVEMYSGIMVLSITGFLLFLLVDVAERRICRWRA